MYDCLGIRIHPSTASSAVYTLLDKAAEGDAGQGQVDETASSLTSVLVTNSRYMVAKTYVRGRALAAGDLAGAVGLEQVLDTND
mgnify:CR=1 FL=1